MIMMKMKKTARRLKERATRARRLQEKVGRLQAQVNNLQAQLNECEKTCNGLKDWTLQAIGEATEETVRLEIEHWTTHGDFASLVNDAVDFEGVEIDVTVDATACIL